MSVFAPNLTVSADDFGIGIETSRGIVDCFRAGAIDRTSAMVVTGDRLEKSLPLLSSPDSRQPLFPIGLHLTLTSPAGTPLVATKSSGLVTPTGTFRSLPDLYFRCKTRRVSPQAILDELSAQVARFQSVFGTPPPFIDGHHHAHQLPLVRDVVAGMLSRNELPNQLRSSLEPPETWAVPGARLRRSVIRHLAQGARPKFISAGAELRNGFFGVLHPEALLHPNPWAHYLRVLPPTSHWEMMVHPGHPDPDLAGRDTYLSERRLELDALLRLAQSPLSPLV